MNRPPNSLNTRGKPYKYRLWPAAGLPRYVRERIDARDRMLAGFTWRGYKRKQRPSMALHGLEGKERRNAVLALYRAANYALGLTARGTPRKMFTKPFTRFECAAKIDKEDHP